MYQFNAATLDADSRASFEMNCDVTVGGTVREESLCVLPREIFPLVERSSCPFLSFIMHGTLDQVD